MRKSDGEAGTAKYYRKAFFAGAFPYFVIGGETVSRKAAKPRRRRNLAQSHEATKGAGNPRPRAEPRRVSNGRTRSGHKPGVARPCDVETQSPFVASWLCARVLLRQRRTLPPDTARRPLRVFAALLETPDLPADGPAARGEARR